MGFYKRERCPEVAEAARRIKALTGCEVILASKNTGSMRPYLNIILRATQPWPEDFTETIPTEEKYASFSRSKATDWLESIGLPRVWLSVGFATHWNGSSSIREQDKIKFTLKWADLYKMGWAVPEIRTPREIAKGLSLGEAR